MFDKEEYSLHKLKREDQMFGRIRSSPSPAEWLELERPPSKLFKDDSLSIYEATLVKLKQGSQRSTASVESDMNSGTLEGSSKSSELSSGVPDNSSCIGVASSPNQERRSGRGISIHYLFSKYTGSHPNQGSTSNTSGCYSVISSACASDSELIGCSKHQ